MWMDCPESICQVVRYRGPPKCDLLCQPRRQGSAVLHSGRDGRHLEFAHLPGRHPGPLAAIGGADRQAASGSHNSAHRGIEAPSLDEKEEVMRRLLVPLLAATVVIGTVLVGCAPAAPAAPTAAPAAPTAAPAAPTAAPAQPTAAPAKKVEFPEKNKTITLLVPFAAGGGSDVMARVLAPLLEKELGVPVQVLNRDGGGGDVGTIEFLGSEPGYTILQQNFPAFVTAYEDPERKAPFKRKDFQALAIMAAQPGMLAVHKDSPLKTIKDLVDAGKARPGQFQMGFGGVMSSTHVAAALFQKAVGVEYRLVPLGGGAALLTALLGGHVDSVASVVNAGMVQQSRAGEIRILGVMDDKESEKLPGVPTLKSQGYALSYSNEYSWLLHAQTPKEIIDVIGGAFKKIGENPEFRKKMDEADVTPAFRDAVDTNAMWEKQESEIGPLVELMKKGG